ncbi:hypothetical protein Syun_029815 [Stephania yunnanensis]|uniref:Uncharacterized protein n=1 Tax=Stephania yunnanensis TaxID=152371 RepID=A0AAP0HK74_9MAGN
METGVDDAASSVEALDIALQFISIQRANIAPENAIVMADVVIALLYGVRDDEEEMMTAMTTYNDGATTSTTV